MDNSEEVQQDYRYRFDFSEEELWRAHLKDYGFVVISNWLSEEIC